MIPLHRARAPHARKRLLLGAACLTCVHSEAVAQGDSAALEPILIAQQIPEQVYVWGLRQNTIGQAQTSSEGVVNFAEFQDRPLLRPGELVEVVPGVAATQHSGSGKANQYFLRGFNLDHGTDFSVSFDGVPLNLPTHGHGQGYLDLNSITPEFIQLVSFRKGPYFADAGDFSSAGTVALETFSRAPRSFAEFTGGEHNYYRALGSADIGEQSYIGGEFTYSEGPWVNPEDLRKFSMLGRFGLGGNWSLTALAYSAKWNSTDQIPERAIQSGLITRLGAIDPSDGGKTSRFIGALRNEDLGGWSVLAYVQKYEVNLWSKFTFVLDDPVDGDQFEQADRRWIFGGAAARTWDQTFAGWTISTGAQFRDDDIGKVGLYRTVQRVRTSTVRADTVNEWTAALWTEAAQAFGPVRATLGLRFDAIGADIKSDVPQNSGDATDTILSPKLALAWLVSPDFELYADGGRGFHSNDARGATATIAPSTGLPVDKVDLFAPSWGAETGFRWNVGGLNASASVFWLHLDSELIYVGDAGDTESTSATERVGGELLLSSHPINRIDIDFSAAATHARYLGHPIDGDHIPNALEYVMTGGISALVTDNLSTTVTVRYLGPAPLTQDGLVRSHTALDTNFLIRYRLGRFTLTGQILNLLNNSDNDIQYFYASRLPGEPAAGVDDRHIHPMEPRTWRLGLRVSL